MENTYERYGCMHAWLWQINELLTRLRDVIPIWRIEFVLRLEDLLKEFGVIFVVERGIATEPNGEQEKRQVTLGPVSAKKVRKGEGGEVLLFRTCPIKFSIREGLS